MGRRVRDGLAAGVQDREVPAAGPGAVAVAASCRVLRSALRSTDQEGGRHRTRDAIMIRKHYRCSHPSPSWLTRRLPTPRGPFLPGSRCPPVTRRSSPPMPRARRTTSACWRRRASAGSSTARRRRSSTTRRRRSRRTSSVPIRSRAAPLARRGSTRPTPAGSGPRPSRVRPTPRSWLPERSPGCC